MRFSAQIASMVLAATSAMAAPRSSRSTLITCDSFASHKIDKYIIYQNNWGQAQATSGSQCTSYGENSVANTIAWETNWKWEGGPSSVKSYANAAVDNVNKKLKDVKSISSTWKWTYSNTNIVADVAYDLWLAPTSGGKNSYEIMIWLAAYGGAGPISSTGSSIDTPSVGPHKFKLYSGRNGDTTVYSFVADSEIKDYSGDLMEFFNYLVSKQGVSADSYITSLQAGTEPFTGGETVFKTTAYSLTVA